MGGNFAASGVPLVDFEIGGKHRFDRVATIARIARRHGANAVHTQGPPSLDLLAGLAARLVRIPLVVTRPAMIDDYCHISTVRRVLYASIDRYALRLASRVVAISERGRSQLAAGAAVPPGRLDVVYNGVSLERFVPSQRPDGLRPTVGMVGQLTEAKGWRDFLAVVAAVAGRFRRVRALVVGAGPWGEALRMEVQRQGLEEFVEFKGQVETVSAVLEEMDVFLLTSRREGLSMAVLEAMSCGLPVVATDVGAIREQVVEGQCGFVRPPGDCEGLASAVVKLLESPSARRQFGEAARDRVQGRFSEEKMAEGYATVYRKALAGALRG